MSLIVKDKAAMKVAIFGGAGFIGSWIVDRLLQEKFHLNIFEHQNAKFYRDFDSTETVNWFSGNFLTQRDIEQVVEDTEIIIHLISTTVPKNSNDDPIFDVQTNLIPSINLFNKAALKKVKKIIFISSGGTIYGKPQYLPIDEMHPTEPEVSYGITKLAIEKYLLLHQEIYGIKAIILRVSNPYGARQSLQNPHGVINHFLHKILKNSPLDIYGDGSDIRDYIHVSDVAEACYRAILYSGKENIFNVGSGKGTNLHQLIDYIKKELRNDITLNYLPSRKFDVNSNILNINLAREELKWSPQVTLKDGLAKTINWLKNIII